jgi:hypothetical protein
LKDVRSFILRRLLRDLVGPAKLSEQIADRPSDRYLTGILFPPRTRIGSDQDDDADTAMSGETDGNNANDAVATANVVRPSTAGLSFAIDFDSSSVPAITLRIACGVYSFVGDDAEAVERASAPGTWKRTDRRLLIKELVLVPDQFDELDLAAKGLPGMHLHIRTSRWNSSLMVTAVISNENVLSPRPRRREIEERSFFQVGMKVAAAGGCKLVARPDWASANDDDGKAAALIYRDAQEYAVGHVCSATWSERGESVPAVRTSWIPAAVVPATSPDGDKVFRILAHDPQKSPLSAQWLADADSGSLMKGLGQIASCYEMWIEDAALQADKLDAAMRGQAAVHIARCRDALLRIRSGIDLLSVDEKARLAFQFANRAMLLQQKWSGKSLSWRPFQLAFCLLALSSTSNPEDKDRDTMDLLWFPTGGGKTEAYLLLTAFTIFLRRLRSSSPSNGGGITVLMRYTLRLLTIQQFDRAAAVICACELIRTGKAAGAPAIPAALRKGPPISLGLWVGQGSTPNNVQSAVLALENNATSTPAQVRKCPCCKQALQWSKAPAYDQIWARCTNKKCDVSAMGSHLPIWTVDEDVYRELPSLLISTADKFAQIARNPLTSRLFGIGTDHIPPELIIQDELHLISGPLGTLAGIYEIAIDELCMRNGIRPKVIGSTATIRRAEDQIRALFNRRTFQFPPPGLEHSNSGFAVAADPSVLPGRLYVGLTTAGRSAKFALQAIAGSLLQIAVSPALTKEERDPYWTMVAYFNSLRELGGALVLMQDDATKSAEEFARRRNEKPRSSFAITELTSRVESSRIPAILSQLDQPSTHADAADIVLASNMISVGVDIPRLGLMVVNGQPKGIAEYIQATSRVGRNTVKGLVISVFNANKARDRSHYETFRTWHQSLYRDVEATSVTPFAPRARDRALHAPFVAMARHLVGGLRQEPFNAEAFPGELSNIIDRIVARAGEVDSDEKDAVRAYLEKKLEDWCRRGVLNKYWDDNRPKNSLLLSAETAAERAATQSKKSSAWPTPNSLRSVEASVDFVLREKLGGQ